MLPFKRRHSLAPRPRKRSKQSEVQTKLSMFAPAQSTSAGPPPSGRFPSSTTHIACWNVNGLKNCLQKDAFQRFLDRPELEVLGLNETKVPETMVKEVKTGLVTKFPYVYFACSTDKKGQSGVAILSKVEPKSVSPGIGQAEFDAEGRVLTAEFDSFFVVIVNTPNSGLGLQRLHYRVKEWDTAFKAYLAGLSGKGKGVCCLGDMGVVHQDLDICDKDRRIRDVPGTTYQEKDNFSKMLGEALIDTYRQLHPTKAQFSWFRNEVEWRRNQGWRVDYALATVDFMPHVRDSVIFDKVRACEHCPIEVLIETERQEG